MAVGDMRNEGRGTIKLFQIQEYCGVVILFAIGRMNELAHTPRAVKVSHRQGVIRPGRSGPIQFKERAEVPGAFTSRKECEPELLKSLLDLAPLKIDQRNRIDIQRCEELKQSFLPRRKPVFNPPVKRRFSTRARGAFGVAVAISPFPMLEKAIQPIMTLIKNFEYGYSIEKEWHLSGFPKSFEKLGTPLPPPNHHANHRMQAQ